jgi:uncharacterized protein with HEPN domain
LRSERQIRRFEDILNDIARIERFTAGMDLQAFSANEQATFAVLHALLILSEAARRLGIDAETQAPEQPWQAIRSLGNVLRHEYEGVDLGAIWRIVADDLPALKRSVERALVDLRSGETS